MEISYSVEKTKLILQVVLLTGFTLKEEKVNSVKRSLVGFDVEIRELHLTRDQFNENRGAWRPIHYSWLDYLLFAKAET